MTDQVPSKRVILIFFQKFGFLEFKTFALPLKHHSRMPPLLKMEKKSNMTAPVSSKVCKQLFDKYELCTKDNLY